MKNLLNKFFILCFPLFCFIQQDIVVADENSYSGKGSSSSSINLSDNELVKLAYSKSDKYPPGFYSENPEGNIFYEHMYGERIFTNNKNEALKWSNATGESSSVPTELVESRETNKYFEFIRSYPKASRSSRYFLSRVHKSSYYEGRYPYDGLKDYDPPSEFSESDFSGSMSPQALLEAIKVRTGIVVTDGRTPIELVNEEGRSSDISVEIGILV